MKFNLPLLEEYSSQTYYLLYFYSQSDIKKAQQICAEKINTRRTIQNLESEVTQINKQIRAEEKR